MAVSRSVHSAHTGRGDEHQAPVTLILRRRRSALTTDTRICMRISEMSRDEKRDFLERAYDAAVEAHGANKLEGGHPSHTVVGWSKLGQGRDVMPGNVASSKEIEDENPLAGADPESPGGNRSGASSARAAAHDGHYQLGTDGVPRFTLADGRVIAGDAALAARARQSDPANVAAAERLIPGYGRIR
jgi:hypothetical protein